MSAQTPPSASFGLASLPGAKAINLFGASINGSKDLGIAGSGTPYTVPTGRRALWCGTYVFNPTGGGIFVAGQLKVSGSYFRINSAKSLDTLAAYNLNNCYVAEAGESISITANVAALNCYAPIIEFSAAGNLRSVKLTTLAAGNNTVYTCPAGKSAKLVDAIGEFGSSLQGNQGTGLTPGSTDINPGSIFYGNLSGGARTVQAFVVPSGGSAGSTNSVVQSHSVADNVVGHNFSVNGCLSAGDFVVIATDNLAATQWTYVTVIELPA